jgi:cold shock CspA family protein
MSYRFDGSMVIAESPQCAFRASRPFQRVLDTLPEKTVPTALVILGILTGQLRPTDETAARQSHELIDTTNNPPAATISNQTVNAIQWLLHEVGDELSADRKQRVGRMIEAAGLHVPKGSSTSAASHERDNSAGKTDANDEPLPDSLSELVTTDVEPDKASFTCEFCETGFDSEDDLRSHWVDCDARPSDARFRCQHCGNTYIAEYALRQHREACRSDDPENTGDDSGRTQTATPTSHRCRSCGEEFDSRSRLRSHRFTCGSGTAAQGRKVVKQGASGTVVHYDSDDGYGFISTPDLDADQDVFFHITDVPYQRCEVDTFLKFDIVATDDGYKAVNISHPRRTSAQSGSDRVASDRAQWAKDT